MSQWFSRVLYGNELGPVDVFAHHPVLLGGYGALESSLTFARRLDPRLKMLAEIKAATVAGCEWCIDFGSWLVAKKGVSERQLRELPRYAESDAFTALEKLVLDYAAAMTRTPVGVSDELFARLSEHFDAAQVVELTATIATENFRARFNHAVGLVPQGFSEGAFCAVPERPQAEAVAAGTAGSTEADSS